MKSATLCGTAMCDSLRSTTLTLFLLLYAVMYAAFGVASPFLPAFVSARGVPPEQLGLMLGAGTAVRLLTAPLAGRIGDLLQALRVVLVVCIALAAAVTLGYLVAVESHDIVNTKVS
jgi:PPP family 3-phenylpropionic acid transporter